MPNLDQIKYHAKLWRGFLLDFFFPKICVNCQKYGSYLCPDCFNQLPIAARQTCPRCKKSRPNGATCRACKSVCHLDGLLSAGSYGNELLRQIIKVYKYQSVEELHLTLGKYLDKFLSAQIAELKITMPNFDFFNSANPSVVPMPLSTQHQRYRGFNQAELLAGYIAKEYNWPLITNRLIKIKNTKAQTKLSEKKRRSNPKNSFGWQGKTLSGPIILLDDVFTTGSTMNEAARILKANGAKKIWGLVLAKGK